MAMKETMAKSMGRTRPEPDMSRVESVVAAEIEVANGIHGEMTPRERALNMEVISLKRQLHSANARVSVMTMGGDRAKLFKPVASTFERMAAFEGVVLATADMTEKGKLKALAQMLEDVKSFADRREKHLAEVERNVAELPPDGAK